MQHLVSRFILKLIFNFFFLNRLRKGLKLILKKFKTLLVHKFNLSWGCTFFSIWSYQCTETSISSTNPTTGSNITCTLLFVTFKDLEIVNKYMKMFVCLASGGIHSWINLSSISKMYRAKRNIPGIFFKNKYPTPFPLHYK